MNSRNGLLAELAEVLDRTHVVRYASNRIVVAIALFQFLHKYSPYRKWPLLTDEEPSPAECLSPRKASARRCTIETPAI